MTHAEIRALVDEARKWGQTCNGIICRQSAAIETLLAREAEVLFCVQRAYTLSRNDNVDDALYAVLQAIRAILSPETPND